MRQLGARLAMIAVLAGLGGCMAVGPEFVTPDAPLATDWQPAREEGLTAGPVELVAWWNVFNDPILNRLVDTAYRQNNSLKVAGLRVLESRAQLGIAIGTQYPQVQQARGGATYISGSEGNANTLAGDLEYWQYNLGADVVWEMDFWGRFRRAVEAADASLLASIANYDAALVLLTSQVADTYTAIRTTEERLRIAQENLVLQQRSYDIAEVLFRNGEDSELDMQQARTLLLSTQASIPELEIALRQARNALSTLLGQPSGGMTELLGEESPIPAVPASVAVGIPADLLRRRPDVRQAERQAAAQSALVGVAEADLYPSFTLSGSIGLAAASGTDTTRSGRNGVDGLFDSDSLQFNAGPGFTWNILNYGRIKNNIRVQDARLQQLLVNYQDTVLRAAQEVEDALVAFVGSKRQDRILAETVVAARRSVDLSTVRYKEGLADYQRVLDAQQALFAQQQRYVENRGNTVRALVALYKALGGGWQVREGRDFVDDASKADMERRTDWGGLLETGATQRQQATEPGGIRSPDW